MKKFESLNLKKFEADKIEDCKLNAILGGNNYTTCWATGAVTCDTFDENTRTATGGYRSIKSDLVTVNNNGPC